MITPAQSIAKHFGQELGFPTGDYVGECLSWVKQFMQDTQGFTPPGQVKGGVGGAVDYYKLFPEESPLSQYYQLIANNHNDPKQIPSQYDIVIWDGDVPGSQGFGHAAVFNQGTPGAATFQSWDQNWSGIKTVHAQQHVWVGQGTVLGWLHARNFLPTTVNTVIPVIHTLTLPAKNPDGSADNIWHVYNPDGPYDLPHATNVLDPAAFGGLTYQIVGNKGNGIYLINTEMFGEKAIWTNGTNAIIS